MSKLAKWLIIIFCIILIVVLFRIGASIPAGLLSFILFVVALVERIMSIRNMSRQYKQHGSGTTASGNMDRKEALEILELDEKASDDDIKKAYKKLIAKVHPDQGGSKYLSAKLNEAKDVLLKKK